MSEPTEEELAEYEQRAKACERHHDASEECSGGCYLKDCHTFGADEVLRLVAVLRSSRAEVEGLRSAFDARAEAHDLLRQRIEELERDLAYALDGLEEMRPYVSDYFAEKWGHDEYITRTRQALHHTPKEEGVEVEAFAPPLPSKTVSLKAKITPKEG